MPVKEFANGITCYRNPSTRHGWAHGRPGRRNLLGLIPIGAGSAGLVWCLRLHFVGARGSFEMERAQNYLVVRGPYQFTRNPMFLCATRTVSRGGWARGAPDVLASHSIQGPRLQGG
jgi:hypothetical protein